MLVELVLIWVLPLVFELVAALAFAPLSFAVLEVQGLAFEPVSF